MIRLWTDGACVNKGRYPRKGGWGFVAESKEAVIFEAASPDHDTTNNRMELTAVIEGLRWSKEWAGINHVAVEVVSDSTYVVQGAELWLPKWKARGWKLSGRAGVSGGDVKNADLWRAIDELMAELNPRWRWVKGHNGSVFNERADKLATEACRHGTILRAPGGRR